MSAQKYSLKALVLRGSAWTIFGHGTSTLIRLASSLILTRLLVPEVYGVMSLIWMVLYGLQMFSDVGLGPAIIRDKRGDEPDFLNTAWTVQVIRGVVLWGGACLIAWPIAAFYDQPQLVQLIPAAGLTALISGFASTSLHTSRRRMDFKRLILLELSAQIIGFVVTLLWARVHPTPWAIVAGTLSMSLFNALASHVFLPGIRNTFRLERSSLKVLLGFGKWIFLASIFSFLASQTDRILLGYYVDMAQLGIYYVAMTVGVGAHVLAVKIVSTVMLPAYSKVLQTQAHRLRDAVYRSRLGLDALLILPVGALMVLSNSVIEFLYDPRYHEAGWMLQIICVRVLMTPSLTNSETCLIALGRSKYTFVQNVCRSIWMLVCIPLGWSLAGMQGIIWAVALSELPVMAVLWTGLIRNKMFLPIAELRSVLFAAVGAALGYGIKHLFDLN